MGRRFEAGGARLEIQALPRRAQDEIRPYRVLYAPNLTRIGPGVAGATAAVSV